MIINTERWWLCGLVGTEYEHFCFELWRRRSLEDSCATEMCYPWPWEIDVIDGVGIDLYLPECYQLWQKVGVRVEG